MSCVLAVTRMTHWLPLWILARSDSTKSTSQRSSLPMIKIYITDLGRSTRCAKARVFVSKRTFFRSLHRRLSRREFSRKWMTLRPLSTGRKSATIITQQFLNFFVLRVPLRSTIIVLTRADAHSKPSERLMNKQSRDLTTLILTLKSYVRLRRSSSIPCLTISTGSRNSSTLIVSSRILQIAITFIIRSLKRKRSRKRKPWLKVCIINHTLAQKRHLTRSSATWSLQSKNKTSSKCIWPTKSAQPASLVKQVNR